MSQLALTLNVEIVAENAADELVRQDVKIKF